MTDHGMPDEKLICTDHPRHRKGIILRHILGDSALPMQARAAEMLFRPQKISIAHFLSVDVSIQVARAIEDEHWVWPDSP